MIDIQLSERQEKIIDIVKDNEPITGEEIAKKLKLTRATLRPDLSILTMVGILEARPKVGYLYSGREINSIFLQQVKDLKIREVKSLPIIVDEQTTTYDAIVTMLLEDVGSIYVTSNGFFTGIVSRKDFLKNAIGGIDINKIPVGVIMTRMPNIITITLDENISDAAIKIGISKSTLCNYEKGVTIPDWNVARKICDVYQFPSDYIFFGPNSA